MFLLCETFEGYVELRILKDKEKKNKKLICI